MSTVTVSVAEPEAVARHRGIALVFCCTVIGAAAQMLIKTGASSLSHGDPLAMLTNLYLLAGYSMYGISTVLLVLALRKGQLSILYPVISLTYVWVTILSVLVLKETMNPWKAMGVGIIVMGVAVLGRDGRK